MYMLRRRQPRQPSRPAQATPKTPLGEKDDNVEKTAEATKNDTKYAADEPPTITPAPTLSHDEEDVVPPTPTPTPPPPLDAIIIGAGWAGLGAANTLHRAGITSLRVLEARDYVGGRSVTSHAFGPDVSVDLGSAWVHGTRRNPVQRLVKRHGLPSAKSDPENAAVWDAGGRLSHRELDKTHDSFMEFMRYMRRRQKTDREDATLERIMEDYLEERGVEAGSHDGRALRWTIETEILQEYAAPGNELSLKYWDIDDELPGGDSYLTIGEDGGYSAVVQKYAADIISCVALETKVTRVDYGDKDMLRVFSVNAATGEEREPLLAKHVIVTLPLGVLKAGAVQFSPELPEAKREAIRALGNGMNNKVALYWEDMKDSDVFWPKDKEWILRLPPSDGDDSDASIMNEFYNPLSVSGGKKCHLIGFVIGEHAERLEGMSDGQATEAAVQSLRKMFGADRVPTPTMSLVTRWGKDEYSRGSYSFQKIGSNENSRRDLAAPVNDCLWFAGEATHYDYPATTHGALLSGEAAGRRVAVELKRSNNLCTC